MKLYAMRHCEALSSLDDPLRALSSKGRREAIVMADYLSSQEAQIAHVLHSPKLRTKQTAEIIALALPIDKITACDTLLNEEMDVMPLVDMIEQWHTDTLLVGHMPFIPRLIASLSQTNVEAVMQNFITGTCVCLERHDSGLWQQQWRHSPGDVKAV